MDPVVCGTVLGNVIVGGDFSVAVANVKVILAQKEKVGAPTAIPRILNASDFPVGSGQNEGRAKSSPVHVHRTWQSVMDIIMGHFHELQIWIRNYIHVP
jgi:hypothetical protein